MNPSYRSFAINARAMSPIRSNTKSGPSASTHLAPRSPGHGGAGDAGRAGGFDVAGLIADRDRSRGIDRRALQDVAELGGLAEDRSRAIEVSNSAAVSPSLTRAFALESELTRVRRKAVRCQRAQHGLGAIEQCDARGLLGLQPPHVARKSSAASIADFQASEDLAGRGMPQRLDIAIRDPAKNRTGRRHRSHCAETTESCRPAYRRDRR